MSGLCALHQPAPGSLACSGIGLGTQLPRAGGYRRQKDSHGLLPAMLMSAEECWAIAGWWCPLLSAAVSASWFLCQPHPSGSAHPSWSTPMVLCIVSLILIPDYVPQKTTESLILSLLWSGQREVLCCAVDLVCGDKPSYLTLGLIWASLYASKV